MDLGRFTVNSTLGIGGILNPANAFGIPKNDEDFGQTLGRWKACLPGPYVVLPFLGPVDACATRPLLACRCADGPAHHALTSTATTEWALCRHLAREPPLGAPARTTLRSIRPTIRYALHPECLAAAPRVPGEGRRGRATTSRRRSWRIRVRRTTAPPPDERRRRMRPPEQAPRRKDRVSRRGRVRAVPRRR